MAAEAPVGPSRLPFLGASVSGILLFFSQPPFHTFPLPFLCLVPLALGLGSLPPGPDGRWAATLSGLLFGLVYWGSALVWVPLVVGPTFSWAYPGYAVLLLLLGGLSALFGWTVHALHTQRGLPLFLVLSLAWVGVEWLKGHAPFGLAFPWLGLAVSLTGRPALLGLAEWLGEPGVALWIALVNGLLAQAILKTRGGRSPAPWLWAATALFLPGAAGVFRSRTLPLVRGPAVAVVGTQVPAELRDRPEAAARESLDQVRAATAGMAAGETQLLVLPEGALPLSLDDPRARPFLQGLEGLARRLRTPVLFGALGGENGTGPLSAPTNSAFFLPPAGGDLSRYDKSRLVPGMEAGRYSRGEGTGLFGVGEWTVVPMVCYESLFGGLARRGWMQGPRILVNVTSDVWFGRGETLPGSLFLLQHPAHLVLRAVENRIPVARAANGGLTLLLDPLGRVVSGPVLAHGQVLQARLPLFRGRTLFARTGDWVGPWSAICVLLLLAGPWVGRKAGAGGGWDESSSDPTLSRTFPKK